MDQTRCDRLQARIEAIAGDRRSADAVLQDLVDAHGARHRFVCGTHELRLDGVLATCTWGGRGLLNAWMRAARRKLEGVAHV